MYNAVEMKTEIKKFSSQVAFIGIVYIWTQIYELV